MIEKITDGKLREKFQLFLEWLKSEGTSSWRDSYVAHLDRVKKADRSTWLDPTFQQTLWEPKTIAAIGPGNSVTVVGAYNDIELSEFLLVLRDKGLPDAVSDRCIELQTAYDKILELVYPKYTERRPRARIVRLLAAIYPNDMTCLMDARRTAQIETLLGLSKAPTDFVGQNPLIRAHLSGVLGKPVDIRGNVEHSMFNWYMWEKTFGSPEVGAIETVGTGSEPVDVPELSLLPASTQRRSLTCVQNNVGLLVAVARESEQGISRDDLIATIMQEAPQLQSGSASNIISQALGGLGIIKLEDGGYRPTERGLEFLMAPDPAVVLRAPLVGRVFGMGHLLIALSSNKNGLPQQEVTKYLQSLVPTWKTTQPGSYIVAWAKLVGLVHSQQLNVVTQLSITDDGQDYASALPADFLERWRIHEEAVETAFNEPESVEASVNPSETPNANSKYDIDSILSEGCFLPREEINAALELLVSKKNIILQGPPGTGKTWLAKRLGYALIGEMDASRVLAVQFQPSLSYEDFVRGWRPDGLNGLMLADGAFLELIDIAKEQPDDAFVLVIEEINRGNPAQVFGELLTLLEADKRSPREALRLAYPRTPDERVYVPENIYLIGTMNLADRSLALVDLALRRRFGFINLAPSLGVEWRNCCKQAGAADSFIDEVSSRLSSLNTAISDDKRLGDQFAVGHSFVTPPKGGLKDWRSWFLTVVTSEIAPLLNEYWYDDPATAKQLKDKLVQGF
jgi:5-methylcytosine-specific restriction enzyme B